MNVDLVTRFAPSPTGYLHLGHAYSAWLNFDTARQADGRFILRIEDIDATRCKPEFEAAIFEDLSWLDLSWEQPVRRQSERLAIYEATLKQWHERGLVYRCFKTRKDIEEAMSAPHASAGSFRGGALPKHEERKRMDAGQPWAWRLSVETAMGTVAPEALQYLETDGTGTCGQRIADPVRHGDVVLGRKDIGTSYHLSCVMDDADQGVTQVIRGQDLADIVDIHVLLFALLGKKPPVFRHHALVTDETGKRFAKRDQSVTLRALRAEGVTPAEIRKRIGLA